MLKRVLESVLVIGLAVIVSSIACTAKPDIETETAVVTKVINDNIAWFKDKDFERLFNTYSKGPDLFMYQLDTAATIRGFDDLLKYAEGWKNPDVRYGGHVFHELNVHLAESGETAWYEGLLEDCASIKDRPVRCFTTRITGVLEKRDSRWVIVQQHFSLPAEKIAEDWAARTAHPPTPAVEAR